MYQTVLLYQTILATQAHGTPHITALVPYLNRTVSILPFRNHRDYGKRCIVIKFGAVRIRHARDVARIFNHCRLHTQANAKIGHFIFTGKFYGSNLPFYSA